MRCLLAILAMAFLSNCTPQPEPWTFPQQSGTWKISAPAQPVAMPPEFGARQGDCRLVRYAPPAAELSVCRIASASSAFEVLQSFRPTPSTALVVEQNLAILIRVSDPALLAQAHRQAQLLASQLRP